MRVPDPDSISLPSDLIKKMIMNGEVNFTHNNWNTLCATSEYERVFQCETKDINLSSILCSSSSPGIFMCYNLDVWYLEPDFSSEKETSDRIKNST